MGVMDVDGCKSQCDVKYTLTIKLICYLYNIDPCGTRVIRSISIDRKYKKRISSSVY